MAARPLDLVDPFGTFNASALPNTPTARNRPGYSPQFGHLWSVNPRIVLEAKINAAWNGQRTPLEGDDWERAKYGFTYSRVFGGNGLYGTGIPDVTVNGFTGFNGPARVYLMSPTTDIAISETVSYIQGRHTLRGGIRVHPQSKGPERPHELRRHGRRSIPARTRIRPATRWPTC